MARGDIKAIGFSVKLGEETQTEFDDVYFTVKRKFTDRDVKIQKSLRDGSITNDNGHFTFMINPGDTDPLDFGDYDFDIEIIRLPSIKKTFTGIFSLTKEVTHSINEVL